GFVVVANNGNLVEGRIDIRSVHDLPVPVVAARKQIMRVQLVVRSETSVVEGVVGSRVELVPQSVHAISRTIVIGSFWKTPQDGRGRRIGGEGRILGKQIDALGRSGRLSGALVHWLVGKQQLGSCRGQPRLGGRAQNCRVVGSLLAQPQELIISVKE